MPLDLPGMVLAPVKSICLGDVKNHLVAALDAGAAQATTLLVDPPREGLSRQVLETIRCRLPARLIYVSCNPATLARDIKQFGRLYAVRRVCPIDMFPQTAEIEVVASLDKT